MPITNYDEAYALFQGMMTDVTNDMGEEAAEQGAYDLVASAALECDAATARELCRRELGFVPSYVLSHFRGMHDIDLDS